MYLLRPMTPDDIPQVHAINQRSFPMPWSPLAYRHDLYHNASSSWVVLEIPFEKPLGISTLIHWIRCHLAGYRAYRLVGSGGFWLSSGEIHISLIAVAPEYRRRGLGELLLISMLQRGYQRGGTYSILEVRESNQPALNLYHRYHYRKIGVKKGYYRDNQEDAYVMLLRPVDEGYMTHLDRAIHQLHQRIEWQDYYLQQDEDEKFYET